MEKQFVMLLGNFYMYSLAGDVPSDEETEVRIGCTMKWSSYLQNKTIYVFKQSWTQLNSYLYLFKLTGCNF